MEEINITFPLYFYRFISIPDILQKFIRGQTQNPNNMIGACDSFCNKEGSTKMEAEHDVNSPSSPTYIPPKKFYFSALKKMDTEIIKKSQKNFKKKQGRKVKSRKNIKKELLQEEEDGASHSIGNLLKHASILKKWEKFQRMGW